MTMHKTIANRMGNPNSYGFEFSFVLWLENNVADRPRKSSGLQTFRCHFTETVVN